MRANQKYSIETGYFIFTMMPSLRCSLNCPHCYLSKEQRRSSEIMSLDGLRLACEKVAKYYREQDLGFRPTIAAYWYGGEPTEMPVIDGKPYLVHARDIMREVFPSDEFEVRHIILSSLITTDLDQWIPIFHDMGEGYVQSSYDGYMRGKGYMRKWDQKVRKLVDSGLRVGTISVVNREMLIQGPEEIMDYQVELGLHETGWLPFMLNEQNSTGSYDKYAPTMEAYSDFMIRLTRRREWHLEQGNNPPNIGQQQFVYSQARRPLASNVAGQTLFLMPNGDFTLPDYHKGYQEYLKVFGNIFEQEFGEILAGKPRRDYLRRQFMRNGNADCQECPHAGHCVMEFWKPNRDNDDCFGARRYIEWLLANPQYDHDGLIQVA